MLKMRKLPDYHGLRMLCCALGRKGEPGPVKVARRHDAATSTVIYSYNAKTKFVKYYTVINAVWEMHKQKLSRRRFVRLRR